ncbi:MAG: penicillin-binding protein 1A [Burkholderiales bacterium]
MPAFSERIFHHLNGLQYPAAFSCPTQRQRGGMVRQCLWLVLIAMLLALMGLGLWIAALSKDLPDISQLSHHPARQPLQIYTQDGVEIGEYGLERRYFVPLPQIPQQLQEALLSIEDPRFREHIGVDLKGMARAWLTIFWGNRSQGGSTITQQVARHFYLSSPKSHERKIKEILLALKIEDQLSKDQILEIYMNQIYLGQRAYGFEAAAKTYFGRSMADLSIAEYAMLAGLPQNPAHANPISHIEWARKRQLVVLARMRSTGLLDEANYQSAKAQPLQLRQSSPPPTYAQYVADMVRQAVHRQYGKEAYQGGLKVSTSIHSSDQQAAYQALRKGLLDHELRQPYRGPEGWEDLPDGISGSDPMVMQALADYPDDEDLRVALVTQSSSQGVVATLASGEVLVINGEGLRTVRAALKTHSPASIRIQRGSVIRVLKTGSQWIITQWPQAEGALVSMDPHNGQIRSLVGGFDFDRNQFNHADQAWRQPGSSFKPFLYSAALEHGVMPATYINDAPLFFAPSSGTPQGWEPKNADGKFDGPISFKQSLAQSKNLVSIRLLQMTGIQSAQDWISRFGFDADKHPHHLTLAMGSGLVTPLQMASAYAIFANGGYKVAPTLITRMTDAQNNVIFETQALTFNEAQRVIPARNAFITNMLLREVTRGGTASTALTILNRTDIYGKTGTTHHGLDAWFAGFQPDLVAVAWVGYDTPRSLGEGELGGRLALPIWIQFMKQALRKQPEKTYAPPKDITLIEENWFYTERAAGNYLRQLGFDEMPASQAKP